MRKFVFIAEVICFAVAAVLGCIYSDRRNLERERREHIEAVGAKALSAAREMQGDIQRLSSSLDSMVAKIEDCYSKATNDLAGLRQEWESKPNEKIRQILAEAGSKLAEQGQQLVAAREAKARVKSALEPLSADLAEIEGMAITNETTLTMVAQRVRECFEAFSDVKESPDIAEIVRMQYRLRSHVDRIVNEALRALLETLPRYQLPAPRNPTTDHEDIDMESDIVRQKIDSVMICEGDPAAWARAEQLAIIAVRKCPSIRAKAVRALPQVDFDQKTADD